MCYVVANVAIVYLFDENILKTHLQKIIFDGRFLIRIAADPTTFKQFQ